MTDELSPYTWVDRLPTNYYDEKLQQQVQGYRLRATWNKTGELLTVYWPATKYTPDQVDAAMKAAGAKDEAIAELGAPPES